ncbi:hypothetical protein WISP_87144 [Willisornis vidua]|uniref:Uncharacterized protein n=1 Tax=Willisornis vidua TaxID=1566151 RepID=A0ABQ9D7F9_9PASS|nr:hypothetical protein WISP_87144 [Willisornis vidua]
MIREMEHLSYEERLRQLGFFNLEKKRLQRDLVAALQYLKVKMKRAYLQGPVVVGQWIIRLQIRIGHKVHCKNISKGTSNLLKSLYKTVYFNIVKWLHLPVKTPTQSLAHSPLLRDRMKTEGRIYSLVLSYDADHFALFLGYPSYDDTKLCGAVSMLEGSDASQRHLDRPERWDFANLMKFKRAKCKGLHLGQGNHKHKHELGREWVQNNPEEDWGMLQDVGGCWGVLVDERWT